MRGTLVSAAVRTAPDDDSMSHGERSTYTHASTHMHVACAHTQLEWRSEQVQGLGIMSCRWDWLPDGGMGRGWGGGGVVGRRVGWGCLGGGRRGGGGRGKEGVGGRGELPKPDHQSTSMITLTITLHHYPSAPAQYWYNSPVGCFPLPLRCTIITFKWNERTCLRLCTY